MENLGHLLWQTTRGFQEASMLLEHIGRHMQENGESSQAEILLAKAREMSRQASEFQKIAIGRGESLHAGNMRSPKQIKTSNGSETGE